MEVSGHHQAPTALYPNNGYVSIHRMRSLIDRRAGPDILE